MNEVKAREVTPSFYIPSSCIRKNKNPLQKKTGTPCPSWIGFFISIQSLLILSSFVPIKRERPLESCWRDPISVGNMMVGESSPLKPTLVRCAPTSTTKELLSSEWNMTENRANMLQKVHTIVNQHYISDLPILKAHAANLSRETSNVDARNTKSNLGHLPGPPTTPHLHRTITRSKKIRSPKNFR